MQIEHKTEKGTLLFLNIENDYSIAGLNDGHIYFWTSSLFQSMRDYPLCYEIPNGNFEYIGLTSEVTEKQLKEIGFGNTDYIEDGLGPTDPFVHKLDSFKSLMQHLQITDEKCIVLFKPND